MIRNDVGKGAIYLYIQLIASMISGYIFLIILARVTTAETIGTFSLLVSISEIFANIAVLGLPDSIQKFVGKSLLQKKQQDAKLFVKISFIILAIGLFASCLTVLFIERWFSNAFGIGLDFIIIINLLIASYAVYSVLYAVVIASLKTRVLPIIIIVSSVAKVVLSLSLVLSGYGVLGLTLGYTFFGQVLSSSLLVIFVLTIFKSGKKLSDKVLTIRTATKNLLTGGIVAWIPVVITTLGIDLGTLVLYNIYGSHQSGVYFISLALANAVNAIVFATFTIALPVLSSMQDGRKRFVWQIIRISGILALPISSSIIFYSNDVMHLIGPNYEKGSFSLQILLLSTFPIIVLTGVETLVYSYGNYKHTLAINLASAIPRTFLYFALVPIYGITGVAFSFTFGAVMGFIASLIVAKRIHMSLFWKPLALAVIFPIVLSFTLASFDVHAFVGVLASLGLTYLLLMKFHIIEKTDGMFFVELMPNKSSKKLIFVASKFEKIIDWFYR